MKKLSTGQPSTLGTYRDNTAALVDEGNKALKYLDDLIDKSPNGREEEVLADEGQMVNALMIMAIGDQS